MSDFSPPGPETGPELCPVCHSSTPAAVKTATGNRKCSNIFHDLQESTIVPLGTLAERVRVRMATMATMATVSENPLDRQVGGDHYRGSKIQPVQVALDWRLDFCLGSVLKYINRLYTKGDPIENLDKAIHFLQIARADIISRLPAVKESDGAST